jgi:hypothetical protein
MSSAERHHNCPPSRAKGITMTKTETAEKPKAAKPAPATNKIVMLAPARMMDPGFGWRTFEATLPDTASRDHILSGAFWRLCGRRIRRGDKIAWRTDSLLRFGELVVVAVDQGNLQLRELWSREVEPATTG